MPHATISSLRGSGALGSPPPLLVGIDVRHRTHAGLPITGLPAR